MEGVEENDIIRTSVSRNILQSHGKGSVRKERKKLEGWFDGILNVWKGF